MGSAGAGSRRSTIAPGPTYLPHEENTFSRLTARGKMSRVCCGWRSAAGSRDRLAWRWAASALAAGRADELGRTAPLVRRRVGELGPAAGCAAERAIERGEAVLVAVIRIGAGFEEDVDDARPAEEGRPAQRRRVVLGVAQRDVGAARGQHPGRFRLVELRGDMQRIREARIRLAHRV